QLRCRPQLPSLVKAVEIATSSRPTSSAADRGGMCDSSAHRGVAAGGGGDGRADPRREVMQTFKVKATWDRESVEIKAADTKNAAIAFVKARWPKTGHPAQPVALASLRPTDFLCRWDFVVMECRAVVPYARGF